MPACNCYRDPGEQVHVPDQSGYSPSAALLALDASPWSDIVARYVLESPVLGASAVMLVGLIGAEVLRRTAHGRAALITLLAAIAVSVVVVCVGIMVVTPTEQVTASTRTFVRSVVDADDHAAGALLGGSVLLSTEGRVNAALDRGWLLSVIRGLGGVFRSHSCEVLGVEFDRPIQARSRFFSRAEFARDGPGWVTSTWELTWRLEGGSWRITRVDCQSILGRTPTSEWVRWGERQRR